MLGEWEKLAREAAAQNEPYEGYLLRLTEAEVTTRAANALAAVGRVVGLGRGVVVAAVVPRHEDRGVGGELGGRGECELGLEAQVVAQHQQRGDHPEARPPHPPPKLTSTPGIARASLHAYGSI